MFSLFLGIIVIALGVGCFYARTTSTTPVTVQPESGYGAKITRLGWEYRREEQYIVRLDADARYYKQGERIRLGTLVKLNGEQIHLDEDIYQIDSLFTY